MVTSEELVRWVGVLGRVADDMNRVVELGPFLDRVAAACAELSGCEFALIRLERPELLLGSFGLPPEYRRRLLAAGGADFGAGPLWSAIREAIKTRQPVLVPDFHAEPRLGYWTPISDKAGIRSYASFPLIAHSGCVGALNVYYAAPHDYSAVEVAAIRALADYTAIAVEAATLRSEREAQFASLQRSLARRAQVDQLHSAITSVALTRQGAAGTLNALAEVLGSSSLFEDTSGRIVATASPGKSRSDVRWIAEYVARQERSNLENRPASELVGVVAAPGRRLYRASVLVEGSPAGTVWMLTPDDVDDELAQQAIEYSSVVLALDLTGRIVEDQNRERIYEDVLSELLAATDADKAEIALEKAVRLGHSLHPPIGMAVAGRPGALADPEAARRQIIRIRRHMGDPRESPFVSRHGSVVVALWSEASVSGPWDGRGSLAVNRLVESLPSLLETPAVVCMPSTEINELAANLRSGTKLLALALGSHSSAHVIDGRRTGLVGLLADASDPGRLVEFRNVTVGPLMAYDSEHRTNLLETLEVLLEHDFRVKDAARALHIHPNTLAYRLRRAEEVLGVSLRAGGDLLSVHLALAVHRVLE